MAKLAMDSREAALAARLHWLDNREVVEGETCLLGLFKIIL